MLRLLGAVVRMNLLPEVLKKGKKIMLVLMYLKLQKLLPQYGKCLVKVKRWWKNYVLNYVNGKMRPIETIPGMGEGEIKENDGGGELSYDIL
jgi:hypothetical protein